MSNIDLIIEERPRDIGNFMVGRLLPFREKRMVGPFIFIDHLGPAVMSAEEQLDIGPHPHIGLSTLTYLFEGNVRHRDSLGTDMEIRPGQVNWMTAGKGIVHSERTPVELRGTTKRLHGLQIWVALPKDKEQMKPDFFHADESELPAWVENDVSFRLVAGTFGAERSPVPVHSPLYLLEVKSDQKSELDIGDRLFGECGIYILEGTVICDGHAFGEKELLVAKDVLSCRLEMAPNTIIYFFGGDTFEEPRHIYWNFVSSDAALIEKAKDDWKSGIFPQVFNETDLVPLPDMPDHLKART